MQYVAFVYPSGKLAQMTEAEFDREFGPTIKRVIVQPIPRRATMQNLFYFDAAHIPAGVVSSTARKGDDWLTKTKVGDVVKVRQVHGDKRSFGYSVVVAQEFLSYEDVLANAQHNSVGYGKAASGARADLWDTLNTAYGNMEDGAMFSVLHLLPLNDPESIVADGAESLVETAKSMMQAVVQKTTATLINANDAMQLLLAHTRVVEMRLSEATSADEVAARNIIDHITNVAAGAIAARSESRDVGAVTVNTKVGEIEESTSIIFSK